MKLAKLVVIGVLGLGLTGSSVVLAQNSSNSGEFMSTSEAVAKVKAAKTASDAVTAYADAVSKVGDSVGVKQAFIVRMIDLGSPELAENQAHAMVDLNADPMSMAVVAYAHAKRNEVDPAIANLSKAVGKASSNAFVANTAGQILAWYDVRTAMDPSTATEATRTTVEEIRTTVGRRNGYDTSYRNAMSRMVPPEPQEAMPETGTRIHLVNGDHDQVGVYGGSPEQTRLSPLAMFFASSYGPFDGLFLGGYGYGGYGGYGGGYAVGNYRPIPPADYYYYDYWNRGVGPVFPFPSIGRDTRYLRLNRSSFALITDGNPVVYQSLNPWYNGQFSAYPYQQPFYGGGYYGGGGYYRGGYGGGYRGGYVQQGTTINPFRGIPGSHPGVIGNSRLSQRMRADDPVVNAPFYNVTAPYGGGAPINGGGGRPRPQPFFGR